MKSAEEILATPLDAAPVAPAATREQRLAKALAAKEAREKRDQEERAEAELVRLELIERFESEIGREGRDFAIIDVSDLGEGFVVVKLGPGVLWKAYSASKMNAVDTENFVLPCIVHPTKEAYKEIVARRGFVADSTAIALANLYGARKGDDQKK